MTSRALVADRTLDPSPSMSAAIADRTEGPATMIASVADFAEFPALLSVSAAGICELGFHFSSNVQRGSRSGGGHYSKNA